MHRLPLLAQDHAAAANRQGRRTLSAISPCPAPSPVVFHVIHSCDFNDLKLCIRAAKACKRAAKVGISAAKLGSSKAKVCKTPAPRPNAFRPHRFSCRSLMERVPVFPPAARLVRRRQSWPCQDQAYLRGGGA